MSKIVFSMVVSGVVLCGAVQSLGANLVSGIFTNTASKTGSPASLSFYASFNESPNAEVARSEGGSGGFGITSIPDGFQGGAIAVDKKGGHLNFCGEHNVNPETATISFYCKGPAASGEEGEVWLWQVRTTDSYYLGVKRTASGLSLILNGAEFPDPYGGGPEILSRVDVPCSLESDMWHHVTASWDSLRQKGWVGFDDKMAEGDFVMPRHLGGGYAMYLAGGAGVRKFEGGMLKPGNCFDELTIYDRSLATLYNSSGRSDADAAFDASVDAGARRLLKTLSDLQDDGGWQRLYTWPTLLGAYAQGREYVEPVPTATLDKMQGTPRVAGQFLYAYEVLRDPVYLDVAKRTGELLLAAQTPGGYWYSNYQMTPCGPKPSGDFGKVSEVKIQDGVQSDPLGLLMALYRVTGDERFRDGAVVSGEFYLKMQNPDGSWSHHIDFERDIGVTARGEPQGGEINDYATNYAIDSLVLMWHITKDPRYMAAVKRAGDWFVESMLDGPVRGWALQYNGQIQPTWARLHEPPALSRDAVEVAAEALIEVYRLSKDERYLEPLRETAAWLKATFPDGTMYQYYDPKTGRPIAAWMDKIYFLDDPVQFEAAKQFPMNPLTMVLKSYPDLEGMLANAAPTDSGVGMTTTRLKRDVTDSLSKQNEAGVFLTPNVGSGPHTLGRGFNAYNRRLTRMLAYLERTAPRVNAEERSLGGEGDLLKMAITDNWYDVEWPSGE